MSHAHGGLCDNPSVRLPIPVATKRPAVPDFQPFSGIHYDPARFGAELSDLTAPPYDVIDDDRRSHLRARHDHNAVHLTLPEGTAGRDRYAHAGDLWRSWRDAGVLITDRRPAFYVYRVTFEDDLDQVTRQTTGVIGALEVCPPGEGSVLPHERTMPKPRGDRLDLLRATRANLEPIWGLSLAAGLTGLLAVEGEPMARCADTRGSRHELFRIDDPARMAAITAAVASTPVVLADGHHRYETSLHFRDEQQPSGTGTGLGLIMTLVVELVDDQLAVQPIHRVVSDLVAPDALRRALAAGFDVRPLGANEPDVVVTLPRTMRDESAMVLIDAEGIALAVPRAGALDDRLAEHESGLVHGVDAARFEVGVAPALEALGASVTYRHDHVEVAEQVRKGVADAAVLLRAVDVSTIRAVAQAGERMPQKTTFFHPKPSTGLVFRSLDA